MWVRITTWAWNYMVRRLHFLEQPLCLRRMSIRVTAPVHSCPIRFRELGPITSAYFRSVLIVQVALIRCVSVLFPPRLFRASHHLQRRPLVPLPHPMLERQTSIGLSPITTSIKRLPLG